MFLIPTIMALIVFVFLRPHEVFESLHWLTLTSLLGALTFGLVLDLRLRYARLRVSPVHGPILALFVLCIISLGLKAPGSLGDWAALLVAALFGFLFIAQSTQSLRAFESIAYLLAGLTLFLALLGIDQGLTPAACYEGRTRMTPSAIQESDGRSCQTAEQCHEGGKPGMDYQCERPGHFGTHSIGGRVRFRGFLEDPNELSMAIAIGLPFAFGLYSVQRSTFRLLIAVATLVAGSICMIMTQSRSGQLSVLAALGVYFIRRFGRRGAIAAAVVGLPLLLLGGRSGEEADSSSIERLECWRAALSMWHENPFFGVGKGQFGEHHYLTAHSSFMLSLAELGPIGLFLWTLAIYAAFKVVLRAGVELGDRPEAVRARAWATSLLASMAGFTVSAFFLSVTYHAILWLYLGLVGGFYGAIAAHDPKWRVSLGWRDFLGLAIVDIAFVAGISFYLSAKGI